MQSRPPDLCRIEAGGYRAAVRAALMSASRSRPVLPRTIWILGLTSLLMDSSSEIVHAILPLFLTVGLGSTPAMVGLIDGIAEATATSPRSSPVLSAITGVAARPLPS